MKKQLVYFLCIFLVQIVCAQKVTESSKLTNIDAITDNYKIGLEMLSNKKYKQAYANITLGLASSKKIKNKNLIAFGYQYQSDYFKKKKKYQIAIDHIEKSLQLFIGLKNNEEIYNCNYKLGRLYFNISEYDKSLENYFASLKNAEQNKKELQVANTLSRIGGVYLLTSDLKTARINFNKALVIYKKLNNDEGIIGDLLNLGVSYQKEGSTNNNDALVLKAIAFFKEGLEIINKDYLNANHAILLGNIGSSFRYLKRYDESLEFLFKALDLKIKLKNFSIASHSCNDISETYIKINKLSKAKQYALKAVEYSKGLNLHQERFACYLLSRIEYKTHNYKSSRDYLKKYHQIDDSLFSVQKIAKINDLQIKYETKKKNLKIEAQESNIALLASKNRNKNQLLLFGGTGLLSILVITLLFFSRNTAQKEIVRQDKFSQALLQSQEEERTRLARELHDSVGQQLTLIKRKSQNLKQAEITVLTNNALEEVRSISRGLYPPLLKELGLTESITQLINEYDAQTDLFFTLDIDFFEGYFTENTRLNFYRLIQECLTNIVKHAKAKTVTVSIKKQENAILTLISDNGKGFDINDNKKKNSLGLKTIFERIKIMNGKLSIDSKLDLGTSFIFSIPVNK